MNPFLLNYLQHSSSLFIVLNEILQSRLKFRKSNFVSHTEKKTYVQIIRLQKLIN